MAHIYIAFVDTPGIFASLIRRFLKQRYVHVVLSGDADLAEAYSVGRRNPAVPVIAGFEKEDKNKILHAFPTAYYRICELPCTLEQKRKISLFIRRTTIPVLPILRGFCRRTVFLSHKNISPL